MAILYGLAGLKACELHGNLTFLKIKISVLNYFILVKLKEYKLLMILNRINFHIY